MSLLVARFSQPFEPETLLENAVSLPTSKIYITKIKEAKITQNLQY
jgi:hypothetical protein